MIQNLRSSAVTKDCDALNSTSRPNVENESLQSVFYDNDDDSYVCQRRLNSILYFK